MTTREINQKQGTSLVWTSSGGDYAMDMSSLADDAGRAGTKADLGSTHARWWNVTAEFDINVAPTAGEIIWIWWSASIDNTDFAGECTGSDSAYNTEADTARLKLVGAFSVSNDTDPQRGSWRFEMPARYGLPVVFNKSGQALTATGTSQKITLTPLVEELQDEV